MGPSTPAAADQALQQVTDFLERASQWNDFYESNQAQRTTASSTAEADQAYLQAIQSANLLRENAKLAYELGLASIEADLTTEELQANSTFQVDKHTSYAAKLSSLGSVANATPWAQYDAAVASATAGYIATIAPAERDLGISLALAEKELSQTQAQLAHDQAIQQSAQDFHFASDLVTTALAKAWTETDIPQDQNLWLASGEEGSGGGTPRAVPLQETKQDDAALREELRTYFHNLIDGNVSKEDQEAFKKGFVDGYLAEIMDLIGTIESAAPIFNDLELKAAGSLDKYTGGVATRIAAFDVATKEMVLDWLRGQSGTASFSERVKKVQASAPGATQRLDSKAADAAHFLLQQIEDLKKLREQLKAVPHIAREGLGILNAMRASEEAKNLWRGQFLLNTMSPNPVKEVQDDIKGLVDIVLNKATGPTLTVLDSVKKGGPFFTGYLLGTLAWEGTKAAATWGAYAAASAIMKTKKAAAIVAKLEKLFPDGVPHSKVADVVADNLDRTPNIPNVVAPNTFAGSTELTPSTGRTYKVFQRGDMNWDQVRTPSARDFVGKTNAEAARAGLRPQLSDGSFAILHHSQQSAKVPWFEASTRYHNIRNAKKTPLRPFGGEQHPDFPLGRGTGSLREQFQKLKARHAGIGRRRIDNGNTNED